VWLLFKSAFEVRMAVKKPAKLKRKLPARYPRDQQIIIFGDMAELDHILELLDALEKGLLDTPDTASYEECYKRWMSYTDNNSVLHSIAAFLRKAYIEFERFHEREGWSYENDRSLQDDFKNVGDFSWRLNEFKQGRLIDIPARTYQSTNGIVEIPARVGRCYEPAQYACAYALYLVMLIR
jgi:hypothetical protein